MKKLVKCNNDSKKSVYLHCDANFIGGTWRRAIENTTQSVIFVLYDFQYIIFV